MWKQRFSDLYRTVKMQRINCRVFISYTTLHAYGAIFNYTHKFHKARGKNQHSTVKNYPHFKKVTI